MLGRSVSLLAVTQGLAICGRCGRRMTVRYHARRSVDIPDYQCIRDCIDDGGPRCQTVPSVDAAIGQLLLGTPSPLALEVVLTVQAELDTLAAEPAALRRQAVERATPPRRPGQVSLPSSRGLGRRCAGWRWRAHRPRAGRPAGQ